MRYTIIVLHLCSSFLAQAQSASPDVIASSGDYFSNANYSMAWTLGEVMTETYSPANNFFTQGFHQPDYGTLTFVENLNSETSVIAFPNPVINDLHISFGNNNGVYLIKIFDAIGNILSAESVSTNGNSVHILPLSNYPSGMYLVQAVNNASFSKSSYTIIKVSQ